MVHSFLLNHRWLLHLGHIDIPIGNFCSLAGCCGRPCSSNFLLIDIDVVKLLLYLLLRLITLQYLLLSIMSELIVRFILLFYYHILIGIYDILDGRLVGDFILVAANHTVGL